MHLEIISLAGKFDREGVGERGGKEKGGFRILPFQGWGAGGKTPLLSGTIDMVGFEKKQGGGKPFSTIKAEGGRGKERGGRYRFRNSYLEGGFFRKKKRGGKRN